MVKMVLQEVESRWDEGTVEFSAGNGKLLAHLSNKGDVMSCSYNGDRVKLHLKLPVREAAKLKTQAGVTWLPVAQPLL